ncbi:MAG: SGNH/GDSL hydrolase family protein, partial [Planctomycetota bacterium]
MMRNTLAAFGGSMLLASFASAQVSEVVYFGDSLVDVGNVDTATIGLIPGGDYFDGRFSNGLLFSEYLATDLGVAVPTNSLAGGNNFAFGGAGASGNNFLGVIPSVENQVNFFLAGNTPTADALYLLWGGSNDIINGDDDVDNGVAAGAMVQSV